MLTSCKHCRGISFNVYGTPGLGLEFIGTKKEPSTTGNAVLQCFRSFMKEKRAIWSENGKNSTTTGVKTSSLSSIHSVSTCTLSHTVSLSPPTPTSTLSRTVSLSPPTSTLSHTVSLSPSTPTSTPSHTRGASSATVNLPADAVLVVDDNNVVGVGKMLPLTSLHGYAIPETHKCILVTWTQENYPAPYPLGRKDLQENLYFAKDMFYAVPQTMLRQLIKSSGKYSLAFI